MQKSLNVAGLLDVVVVVVYSCWLYKFPKVFQEFKSYIYCWLKVKHDNV